MPSGCDFALIYKLSTYNKLPHPHNRCHDRRHGTVERPVTWIYVPHFMVQVRKHHKTKMDDVDPDNREPFPDEPRDTSVQCAFVPANRYRGNVAFTDVSTSPARFKSGWPILTMKTRIIATLNVVSRSRFRSRSDKRLRKSVTNEEFSQQCNLVIYFSVSS
jgi:hypothetical protein